MRPESPPSATLGRTLTLVAIVLVLAVAGANARVLFGGTWDDVRYHTEIAPPRLAAADAIQHGTLPAWWESSGFGVPLAGEPTHGALYPPTWIAASPRALDWLAILHLIWLALGVAVWARLRTGGPPRHRVWLGGAGEPAAVAVAILVATSGLAASAAVRGALPGLAHLPWIGACASWLAATDDRRQRTRATIALGLLVGLVGLSGQLACLVDATILALAIAVRPRTLGHLAVGLGAGLAIAAAQWVPALIALAEPRAGGEVFGLPLARLIELVVPISSGSQDPAHAIAALAGSHAWAPSLFVGAPLLALGAARVPSRRVLGVLGALAVLALVVGRGGWPVEAGAPELHLAALVIVLGAHGGAGLDALIGGERRAFLAVGVGTACTAVGLAALALLRTRHPDAPIERSLIDGAFCVVCGVGVLALCWRARPRALPVVLALLVLPSIGSRPLTAPVTDRVDDMPAWVELARRTPTPRRVFRPVFMKDVTAPAYTRATVTTPGHEAQSAIPPPSRETLADAIDTFGGASAGRWGISTARSEDPARLPDHDRTWTAAAGAGGTLLDRFGVALAILPAATVTPRGFTALAHRGRWALVELPVTPPAAVMRGWERAATLDAALSRLFPIGGYPPERGVTVLGVPGDTHASKQPPLPCGIDDWSPGDIDLLCTTDAAGYAVVTSSPEPGWSVTVDGAAADWVTADVLRRAVFVPAGTHAVHWTFAAPGLTIGLALAGLGLALLLALGVAQVRRGADRDANDRSERDGHN